MYVDRIILAEIHQGFETTRLLYLDLFERARSTGVETICCAVNFVSPNPDPEAFHTRMGFNEAGRAERTREKLKVGVGLAALAPAWEK